MGRRGHSARHDGRLRIQGLHLRTALPEAGQRRVRGGQGQAQAVRRRGAEAQRRRSSRLPGAGRPLPQARCAVCAGGGSLAQRLRCHLQHQRDDPASGSPSTRGTEREAQRPLRPPRLQPHRWIGCRVQHGQARRPAPEAPHRALRADPAADGGLRVPRPDRCRLRVPDQGVRGHSRTQGRRVLHPARRGSDDGRAPRPHREHEDSSTRRSTWRSTAATRRRCSSPDRTPTPVPGSCRR